MIPADVKAEIQAAYSKFLKNTGFRARPTQKRMIAAIAKRLLHSQPEQRVVAIEAGTGTGKTLAYLLAAIPVARQQGKTLIVSTGTIALQEQLVNKDIPDVIEQAGLSFGFQLVKGRGRYLCQVKLENVLATDPAADQMSMYLEGDAQALTADRLRLYQSMENARADSIWDGDRDTWEHSVTEDDWRPLTSDRYQCMGRACPHVSHCAFFSARNQLEDSLVLVANHDLVLSDLALGGGVILPSVEDCMYVFDEAHHLGEKARRHFAVRFRLGTALGHLEQQNVLLTRLQSELDYIEGLASTAEEILALGTTLIDSFQLIRPVLAEIIESRPERDTGDRIAVRFVQGEVPGPLRAQADSIAELQSRLCNRLERLSELLASGESGTGPDGRDRWFPIAGQWLSRAESAHRLWSNYCLGESADEHNQARWVQLYEDRDDYELFASPILAGDVLHEHLWKRGAGAVLTSATLTALDSFDRLKMRTGLGQDTECLQLPSPFDYPKNASLEIPPDAADPKDADAHDAYLVDSIPRLLDCEKANLVLFASGRQMDQVFDRLEPDWQKLVLIQGSRSKQRLLDMHRSRIDKGRGSTIFGLASFAEGIDLPGSYCQHVLIAKIPFSVPTEPEEEALAEWVEARGGNSFRDISLADASMRLVQGVGRLLRSETDQGRVTITDIRLLTKSYGRQLVAALPPMRKVDSGQH